MTSVQKKHSYHSVTHEVNATVPVGSQLQKVKSLKSKSENHWILEMDFYPSPRSIFWVCDESHKNWGYMSASALTSKNYEVRHNTLLLYIKSHFCGKRVESSNYGDGVFTLCFGEGYKWRLSQKNAGFLEWELEVPQKKPFTKSIKLLDLKTFDEATESALAPDLTGSPPKVAPSKAERLIKNVQNDLESAQQWLLNYSSLCSLLQEQPWVWHSPTVDSHQLVDVDAQIERLQKQNILPKSRDPSSLKKALDGIFKERSRQERKVAKSSERLSKLQGGELVIRDSSRKTQQQPIQKTYKRVLVKKHYGLRVEILDGIYGYLGRNAKENDELFRQMRDRDIWFHVRGYSGAHLWILRTDLKLGKDETLAPHVVQRAAKIALWNSKLKNSQSGSVDYTEKRHLKKLKGEAGLVKILKSEVIFVSLEDDFEKTLKWY